MVNMPLHIRRRNKKKPESLQVSRDEFLKTKPVRNPSLEWKADDQGKTLVILPPKERRKTGRLSNLLGVPEQKKFSIDEIGSIVWSMCDGEHNIKNIVEALNQRFKLNREEAETGLQTYMKQLSKKGLVGFILPNETQAKFRESLERK
jgi:hypothetical protein